MKTNLQTSIDEEIELVASKLISNGWSREDDLYFIKPIKTDNEINGTIINIIIYHEILRYYDNEPITKIWIKCKMGISNKWENDKISMLKNYIYNDFKNIKLTPFYDEDAFLGIFTTIKKYDDFNEISFYINPDYPQGYSSNHTIN